MGGMLAKYYLLEAGLVDLSFRGGLAAGCVLPPALLSVLVLATAGGRAGGPQLPGWAGPFIAAASGARTLMPHCVSGLLCSCAAGAGIGDEWTALAPLYHGAVTASPLLAMPRLRCPPQAAPLGWIRG